MRLCLLRCPLIPQEWGKLFSTDCWELEWGVKWNEVENAEENISDWGNLQQGLKHENKAWSQSWEPRLNRAKISKKSINDQLMLFRWSKKEGKFWMGGNSENVTQKFKYPFFVEYMKGGKRRSWGMHVKPIYNQLNTKTNNIYTFSHSFFLFFFFLTWNSFITSVMISDKLSDINEALYQAIGSYWRFCHLWKHLTSHSLACWEYTEHWAGHCFSGFQVRNSMFTSYRTILSYMLCGE